MVYGNTHRYFVRFFMKKSIVTHEEAVNYLKKIKDGDDVTMEDVLKCTKEINKKIQANGFKIVDSQCEVTGNKSLSWIRTDMDEQLKMYSNYTKPMEDYFKEIIKEIFESDSKNISYILCLNLSNSIMAKLEAEKAVKRWINEGYLVLENNVVYLGPRCIAEFGRLFSETRKDDVFQCVLCGELLVFKLTCLHCRSNIHKHCFEQFSSSCSNCPNCNKPWEAYEGGSDDAGPSGRPNGAYNSSESDEDSS